MRHIRCITSIIALFLAVVFTTAIALADTAVKFGIEVEASQIEVNSDQFTGSEEDLVKEIQTVLKEYFVVSEEVWKKDYPHLALLDSSGTVTWELDAEANQPKKTWVWMLRPGGLATVTDEDGTVTYLVKEVK